ncbi:kynureninase [Crossiella cryophila]|uniref:Kynureninase n=1 Tax=Crossiella cryophila TaxID=43355 RepID=A0A7W7CDK2_9PSEU|nr:kynureninase [Crossiella cryophila]MBB4677569.1 kynureninase [Crossiella cryophila]
MSLADTARKLDALDPIAHCRDEFDLDPDVVYLNGNSLGALPRAVAPRLAEVVGQQWGRRLIRGWGEGWWGAPERLGDRLAPLVGSAPGQVVVGDSTSVNLFKALVAAIRLNPGRPELLVDAATFPTDGYIAASVARLTGVRVRPVPMPEAAAEVNEHTAVLLANHVDFRSGVLHDMGAITEAAHRAGALVVWDLCHSVGALPVELDAHQVDLAVGCTYKFLNGGPGAPAFLYVPQRFQDAFDQPLSGWCGHAEPFAMTPEYTPGAGVTRGRTGTPDILSMLALDAALDVWDKTSIAEVRAKGLRLTDFFLSCVDELLGDRVTVRTPRDTGRGNHVALSVPDAGQVMKELIAREVIGDYRPPDVLRFGFAPLYVRYADALTAVEVIAGVI